MGIRNVQVISVPVSDQARSKHFYYDALGFEVVDEAEMGPTMRWLQLGVPDAGFTITLTTWFDDMPPGSLRGLVLGVDDVDVMAKDLHERGYIDDPTLLEEAWGRHVVVLDPDNNMLVLVTPPR